MKHCIIIGAGPGLGEAVARKFGGSDYSISDLADVFAVSRPTIYRTLQRTESAN